MKEEFLPETYAYEAPERSFRALLDRYPRAINKVYYRFIRDSLGLSDEDFSSPKYGLSVVTEAEAKHSVKEIFPSLRTSTNTFERASFFAKSPEDRKALFAETLPEIADEVIYVDKEADLEELVSHLPENLELIEDKGDLFLRKNGKIVAAIDLNGYSDVIEFNEIDHTITLTTGVKIEEAERFLNDAKNIGAHKRYTLFPEVGIEKNVVSCEYIDKSGKKTEEKLKLYDENLGVLASYKLRFYLIPKERYYAYLFKDALSAATCMRELAQKRKTEFITLLDESATNEFLRFVGIREVFDKLYALRGYKKDKRCLIIGKANSKRGRRAKKACALRYGGATMTSLLATRYFNDLDERARSFEEEGIFPVYFEKRVSWQNLFEEKEKTDRLMSDGFSVCEIRPYKIESAVLKYRTLKKY